RGGPGIRHARRHGLPGQVQRAQVAQARDSAAGGFYLTEGAAMPECPSTDELRRYLDRDDAGLDADRRRQIEEHVETCAPCQELLDRWIDALGLELQLEPMRVAGSDAGRVAAHGLGETKSCDPAQSAPACPPAVGTD